MNKKLNKKLNKFRLKRLVLLVFALTGFVLQAEAGDYYAKMYVHAKNSGNGTVYVSWNGDENSSTNETNIAGSADKNEYVTFSIKAEASKDYKFAAWYKDEALTVLYSRTADTTRTEKAASSTGSSNALKYHSYAKFISADTWNEELISGATYTVTTDGDRFKVSCSNKSSYNHNQTFLYVGNVTASSGTVTINFNNSKPLKVKGQFKVNESATLKMRKNSNTNMTLTGNESSSALIKSEGNGILDIQGYSNSIRFIIDGGAVWEYANDTMLIEKYGIRGSKNIGKSISGATISGVGKKITLKYVTLQNAENKDASGGAIYSTAETTSLTYCTIKDCQAKNYGGGIYCTKNLTLNNVLIEGCRSVKYSGGGIFNYNSYNAITLDIKGVTVKNCTSETNSAGGIQSTASFTMDNSCTIVGCHAKKYAGGLYLCGPYKITGGLFDSNTANVGGNLYIYRVKETISFTVDEITYTVYTNNINYNISGGTFTNGYASDFAGGIELAGSKCKMTGNVKIKNNRAKTGAGGIMIGGGSELTITSDSVVISYNETEGNSSMGGGGICVGHETGVNTLTLTHGIISNNKCIGNEFGGGGDGGGIYMRYSIDDSNTTKGSSELKIEGGTIENNSAKRYGGGVYTNGPVTVGGGTISDNTAHSAGGGIYMGPSSTSFSMTGGTITENKAEPATLTAECNGGGVYIEGNNTTEFPVTIKGGTFSGNKATGNGGGFYVGGSMSKVEVSNGVQITCDTAANGAGFYCAGGSLTVSGTSTKINNNVASGNGGGFYGASNITVGEATISGNKAGNGGGFYVNGQATTKIEIKNGSVISGNTVSQDGAGAYIANGKLTVSNSTTKGNTATRNGGGFFVNNGTFNLTGGTIGDDSEDGNGNQAVNGGGVYVASGSTAAFSNGSITSNRAVEGAGAYIATGGTMSMSGSSSITGNETTSLSGHGAGIYQGGTFNVSGSSLQVTNNLLKGTAKDTGIQNNVYLPSTSNYITIVASLSGSANIGITVPDFPAPVIHSLDRDILQNQYQAFQSGTSQLKDDSNICQVLYSDAAPYDLDHIYFIGTWQGYVHSLGIDPSSYSDESFNTIDSPEKLAIYMNYVNGINGFAKHPEANGTMTADVDMSEYLWIPIGTRCTSGTEGAETDPYAGTFDGQGHVIRGLNVNGLVGYANYGLFGDVDGGTVKDVFLTDCDFSSYGECTMGTLVGQLNGGTVMNAEGAGKLGVSNSNSTLGGLVGAMTNNARIVNSMAMCDMTGTKMGGLAGTVASESRIENSFSNAKLTYSGTAGSHTGGIAADNAGTVTNCYSRLRGTAPSNYGSLVGNNSGTVSNSYAQTSDYIYINSGNADSGLGTYGPTVTPYGYGQAEDGDNKVGDTPLCDKLNGNLAEGYAQWMRTSASPINGDYPILKLDYESVSSEDGIVLEYGSLDQSFLRHDTGTALLYGAASVSEPQPSGMTLYIDEDAVMTQSTTDTISAYVGVTFDNSGKHISDYDWHMFSSPLRDAPVAINYTDNTQVPYGHDVHPVQYGFYPESTYDGYFPSNTPYGDYDFYSFDEYSCHWINFKRNSNSHWHEDEEHEQINYTNEEYLVPGKGYLMALSKETYMQSHGTLNDDDVKVNVTVSAPEGYSAGYNLLGNPYQSYLDFDAFAEANSDLWNEGTAGSYLILDADKSGYISYVIGGSDGGEYAPRYLHPHQGFYLKADNAKEETIFTNAMRRLSGTEPSYFRGTGWSGQRNCPLVNLYATDSDGKREIVVVELEREEQSGARKMKAVVNGECRMYASAAGEDYSVLFAKGHVTEVPVRFEAFSEGEFTLTWNTHNAEFSYLHLIDNITGADYDCLSNDSYTFTASPNDYASRFKLRFEYTAEEPAKVEGNDVFSYQRDGELVVCGTGYMQLIDLQGRVLYSTRLADEVNVLAKPSVSAGLYLIQLAGEDGLKVQKIVIQ